MESLAEHFMPVDALYHYTNLGGTKGIISSRKLWATDFSFLNDYSELKLGLERCIETLEELDRVNPSRAVAKTIRDIQSWKVRAFVVSLCRQSNLLSQWREYGQFAIGFDRRGLETVAKNEGIMFGPVNYSPDYQLEGAKRLAMEVLSMSQKKHTSFSQEYRSKAMLFAAFAKDLGFREEEEWRLVVQLQNTGRKIKHRTRKKEQVPYVEIPLAKSMAQLPIIEIVAGPKAATRQCKDLEKFVIAARLNIPLYKSDIPYR